MKTDNFGKRKAKAVRRYRLYFSKVNFGMPLAMIAIAVVALAASIAASIVDVPRSMDPIFTSVAARSVLAGIGIITGVIGGCALPPRVIKKIRQPTDRSIDALFSQSLSQIIARAQQRLDIKEEELRQKTIVLYTPQDRGTAPKDIADEVLYWTRGSDGQVRTNTFYLLIAFFTDDKLSTYNGVYALCEHDLLQERDLEVYYRDVVSVSSEDITTKSKSGSGSGNISHTRQSFSLTFTSGASIEFEGPGIQGKDGKKLRHGRDFQESVRALRAVIRQQREASRRQAEDAASPIDSF